MPWRRALLNRTFIGCLIAYLTQNALAAVIFGKWDPVRAALAALLFGAATNLQGTLSVVGAPVPSQFMLMLPYVVTILAVAGFVGRSRAPAANGMPYIKE